MLLFGIVRMSLSALNAMVKPILSMADTLPRGSSSRVWHKRWFRVLKVMRAVFKGTKTNSRSLSLRDPPQLEIGKHLHEPCDSGQVDSYGSGLVLDVMSSSIFESSLSALGR